MARPPYLSHIAATARRIPYRKRSNAIQGSPVLKHQTKEPVALAGCVDRPGKRLSKSVSFARGSSDLIMQRFHSHAKLGVIFVFQCYKTKWLQAPGFRLPGWLQHFGHSTNRPLAGLEFQLNEISEFERFSNNERTTRR